jgi:epoxyqueuosine reductase
MTEMSDQNTPETGFAANWPANSPDTPDPAQQASDREAGFRISENFCRFDQRDDIFNRAWWDEDVMSDDVVAFYSAQQRPDPRKGDGYTQWDFALLNSSWAVARDYAARGMPDGRREGFLDAFETFVPQAGEKADLPDIVETTARVRQVAKFLGADLFGVTAYDDRWVYAHAARVDTPAREEKDNVDMTGMTTVIVLGHHMDHDLVQAYPSALAAAATGREYSHEAAIITSIASFIHGLGYKAVASSNDTALSIPYAIKAGMGEYGRNQMIITEEFGPRVRFSKIFTDMPLVHDKPKKFGVEEFCNICNKCADACPPKALPKGPPEEGGPNKSSIKGITKWTSNAEKCFKYWTKLRADCAICMRCCPWNKDYSRWSMRLYRKLMGTGLRRFMLWLDDRLGYGGRILPKEWWQRSLPGSPD